MHRLSVDPRSGSRLQRRVGWYRLSVLIGLLLGLLVPITTFSAKFSLPEPVLELLARYKLPSDSISLYVHAIGEPSPRLEHHATLPRNPASVMKLVTTLSAIENLGPTYRFKTDVWIDGRIIDGRLSGNLYIKGYGDPFLVTENFWRLLKDLREAGLQHLDGDLILDTSFFSTPSHDPSRFDNRPHRAYNVGPSALLVNFNVIRFKFFPEPEQQRLRIVADPALDNLKIANSVKLVKGRCTRVARQRLQLEVSSSGPRPSIEFKGSYPESCESFEWLRTLVEPVSYTHGVFSNLWKQLGGTFTGRTRRGTVLPESILFHRGWSLPLSQLIHNMNKYSNNVMTRNLLLTLGAQTYGAPGTLSKGRRAIADWIGTQGMDTPDLFVDNGSGLSRRSRVSAHTLGAMLLMAYESDFMPEFIASLPLSSMDGTLQRRFKHTDMQGKLHMKTGLLNDVRSIAGYMRNRKRETLVVVSLQNYPGVENSVGTQIQDALLQWLYEK